MHTTQTHFGRPVSQPLRSRVRYQSPGDVLNDAGLDALQKRAILSSWASDLFAVESCPWLRQVPGVKAPLRLSEILAALRDLDDSDPPPKGGAAMRIAGLPSWRRPPAPRPHRAMLHLPRTSERRRARPVHHWNECAS